MVRVEVTERSTNQPRDLKFERMRDWKSSDLPDAQQVGVESMLVWRNYRPLPLFPPLSLSPSLPSFLPFVLLFSFPSSLPPFMHSAVKTMPSKWWIYPDLEKRSHNFIYSHWLLSRRKVSCICDLTACWDIYRPTKNVCDLVHKHIFKVKSFKSQIAGKICSVHHENKKKISVEAPFPKGMTEVDPANQLFTGSSQNYKSRWLHFNCCFYY